MKRPIKFRAKGKSDGQWHYGSLLQMGDDFSIVTNTEGAFEMCDVAPETLGQFTGLYDKDFNEIYEGDIVRIYDYMNRRVVFERGAFCYATKFGAILFAAYPYFRHTDDGDCHDAEVIGNVYDNSELIEKIE